MLNFENDPYAKSMVFLDEKALKKGLPLFFDNLNTLLGKMSFFKLNRQAMKDLTDVIDWIDTGNKTLFNPADLKVCLYMFENSYEQT
jgi:hypothetical protein